MIISKQFLPKLEFKLPTIAQEARQIFSFCRPRPTGWDWSERVYKIHPQLKEMVRRVNNDAAFGRQCHTYAKNFIKGHKQELTQTVKRYQTEWNSFGPRFLEILSKHFETNYPASRKLIQAYVSINPICPRFLDAWSFNVRFDRPEYLRKTVCHEILHFLYFKKWREVFPDARRREFDSPHLTWKLSEIMAPIILNHHPNISKIVNLYSPGYREFQNVSVGRKKLIPFYEHLYKKHLRSKQTFADFLKIIRRETIKHRRVIENI